MRHAVAALLLSLELRAAALDNGLARTPQMGWVRSLVLLYHSSVLMGYG